MNEGVAEGLSSLLLATTPSYLLSGSTGNASADAKKC